MRLQSMKIDILTLFPEMFVPLKESIIGKARDKHCLEINLINIRDFSLDKHHKCDDYIFGGGEGLLMTPQPLFDAIESVKKDNSYIIYMSPKGKTLTQKIVKDFSTFEHLIIICGHYEGVDQRVIDVFVDAEISIGDYVLTSESQVEESNFTIIMRPFIEMVAGTLESFTIEYNGKVVNFTKENYLQNMNIFNEIIAAGSITSEIKYDIGNYILFVEGVDFKVENIKSLSPDQALGGGLFAVPSFTSIIVTNSIETIDEGTFDNIISISNVVIESDEIYNSLVDIQSCGGLIQNATTVKVLKSIVDNLNNQNDFLNNDQNYTKSEEGDFYVYSK